MTNQTTEAPSTAAQTEIPAVAKAFDTLDQDQLAKVIGDTFLSEGEADTEQPPAEEEAETEAPAEVEAETRGAAAAQGEF